MKPTRYQRGTAKLKSMDRALFTLTCKGCGHSWDKVFKIGPRGMRRKASPGACAQMASVWNGYGEINLVCPKCSKARNG